jgi:hypothetical protein
MAKKTQKPQDHATQDTTVTTPKRKTKSQLAQDARAALVEAGKKKAEELAGPGGPPVNPSSESDPMAFLDTDGSQEGPPVNPSSEQPQVDQPKPKGKGKGKKKGQDAPQKPQDAPGTALATQADSQAIQPTLAPEEHTRLAELEAVVDKGLDTTFEVASALLEIREQRLYRETHTTWEDYIDARWQMSSRRARQLTASATVMKGLQDAGVTDLPTNEAQARHLAKLPPEQRPEALKEAQESAKAKGRKEPTRSDVQEAVAKRRGRPPGTPNQTPAQKKVQAAVDRGAIPDASGVQVTDVDEGVEAARVADIDLPDAEWLEQFPIRAELNDHCRTLFEQEALFYRWFSPHRKPLMRNIVGKLAAEVRTQAKRVGPYVSRIERALTLADPRTWKVCRTCNGTGEVPTIGGCTDCKTAGYRLGQ